MRAKRWTVLLVDDTADLRYLIQLALEETGRFEVVGQAEDGLRAIALAEKVRPDLILLDINMPVMDGFEALPRILAASPRSRVIIFSGLIPEAGDVRLRGVSGYILKGTPSTEAVDTIIEAMEKAHEVDNQTEPTTKDA